MCWPLPDGWEIHWDLWVEVIGHIAWPFVALIAALLFVGPVRRLVERANKFSAGGISFEAQALTAKVEAIDDQPESAPTSEAAQDAAQDLPTSAEVITTNQRRLEPGWDSIVQRLQEAFRLIEEQRPDRLPQLARTYFRQRKYVLCWNQLVLNGWISFELRDVLKSLYELREKAAVGQLGEDSVDIFNRNADKSALSILNAVRYRLREPVAVRT
ncbi:hypothetical protein [Vitreimonas sp.]|uniref:hypothetical protein n=1 Tax=Vitreimonas sp. TaxID=3069702 RepID=UPI002ED98A45